MKFEFKHSLILLGILLYVVFISIPFVINSFLFILLFLIVIFCLIKLLKINKILQKLIALKITQKIVTFLKRKYESLVNWESKIINFSLNLLNNLFGEFLRKIIKSKTVQSINNSNLSKSIRNDFKRKPSVYIIGLLVMLLIIGLNCSNQNNANRRNYQNQRMKNEQMRLYKERTKDLQEKCFCGYSKPEPSYGNAPAKPGRNLGYKRSCC